MVLLSWPHPGPHAGSTRCPRQTPMIALSGTEVSWRGRDPCLVTVPTAATRAARQRPAGRDPLGRDRPGRHRHRVRGGDAARPRAAPSPPWPRARPNGPRPSATASASRPATATTARSRPIPTSTSSTWPRRTSRHEADTIGLPPSGQARPLREAVGAQCPAGGTDGGGGPEPGAVPHGGDLEQVPSGLPDPGRRDRRGSHRRAAPGRGGLRVPTARGPGAPALRPRARGRCAARPRASIPCSCARWSWARSNVSSPTGSSARPTSTRWSPPSLRHPAGRLGVVKAALRVGMTCTARIAGHRRRDRPAGDDALPEFAHGVRPRRRRARSTPPTRGTGSASRSTRCTGASPTGGRRAR